MAPIKKNSGMTFIEVMLTSAVVSIIMLGAVSLISNIYKGSVTLNLKTVSFNLATEQVEFLKHLGYGSLNLTPDSCILDFYNPVLAALDGCPANPFPVETVVQQKRAYKVYKIVMYAQEDPTTGNLIPITLAQGQSMNPAPLIKILKVVVSYTDANLPKQSVMTGLLTDKSIIQAGIQVSGRVADKTTPGLGLGHTTHGAIVYVTGHPEYTCMNIDDTTGLYTIYNVLPGTYLIYATVSDGAYLNGFYAGNPLVVSPTSGNISGVDILCDKLTSASITGFVTYNNCAPLAKATPENNVLIMCNDGQSVISSSNTTTPHNFIIKAVNAGTTGGGQTLTVSFFQAAPGATPGAYTWVGTVKKTDSLLDLGCITLVPGTTNTGIISFKTLNALDMVSPISGVTIYLDQKNAPSPIPTPLSGVTNITGDLTFAGVVPRAYGITATASNYGVKGAPLLDYGIFAGLNPVYKIYLYPYGSISGTIRDAITTNPIPNIPVRIINAMGAGAVVVTAFSNTMGAYTANMIPVGSDYMVKPYLDGTIYSDPASSPSGGHYVPVAVVQGITTPNKDFSLSVGYKTISGTVSMPECDNDGVLIIAAPSSNTQTPQSFTLTNTGDFLNAQDNYVRTKYPYYGTVTRNNGTAAGSFSINVPASQNVNIYAYYNYVSLTGDPLNPTRSYVKYYKAMTNVSPGSVITVTGSWTPY